MALEKVSCFPNDGDPQVIAGDPQHGDIVRVVGTQDYHRHAIMPAKVLQPISMTRKQLRKHVVAVFGGNGAAAAKLQAYRDAAIGETGTTDAAKRRRLALIMEREEVFTKDEADELMTLFQFAAQDKTDVLAAWPEA